MKYILSGDPVALVNERNNRYWDARKQLLWERRVELMKQHQPKKLYTGSIALEIFFYFTPSQNKKRMPYNPFMSRLDLALLIKHVQDVATGVLYTDDCMIVQVTAEKAFGSESRTEFIIVEKMADREKRI
jgi:Holliday junction resolvase RusA-like endonuclease